MDGRWISAFLIFGLCGIVGVAVDLFDIIAVITNGPEWLYQLDLLTAVIFTAIVFGMDSYYS